MPREAESGHLRQRYEDAGPIADGRVAPLVQSATYVNDVRIAHRGGETRR